MPYARFRYRMVFALVLTTTPAACVVGPRALNASRVQYNEVIQRTTAEQLLLNLVRLQYREPPLFLDVASVSAQFKFSGAGSADVSIFEGPRPTGPNVLGLGGRLAYEEIPTITFAPLQGEDFVKRILAPLPLEALALLTDSGWRTDRVFRLAVQQMNGVDNASRASGPTPDDAPLFEDFAEVCRLLQRLHEKSLLDIRVERVDDGPPIRLSAEAMTAADTMDALDKGFEVQRSDDGTNVLLQPKSKVLTWRVGAEAAETPEVARIVELLRLEPDRGAYRFVSGKRPQAQERTAAIHLVTRSLMGILSYLSQAVDVPAQHRRRRWVTTTLDADGRVFDWRRVTGDLLRIRSRDRRPEDAAVAVRFKGTWFYIDSADLASKSTMALLSQILALQAGEAQTTAPVLTLPVGG